MDRSKQIRVNGYNVIENSSYLWLQVFHHKYPEGGLFSSNDECNFSLKKNRFSVLKYIDETFKINDYYKFIIEYPNENKTIQWDQRMSIMNKNISVEPVIHTPGFSNFNGLGISSDINSTCFDGNPTSSYGNWWYSIGAKTVYLEGFPGIHGDNSVSTKEVSLWIMIAHLNDTKKFPGVAHAYSQHHSLNFSLFPYIIALTKYYY
jgi:hypothetical protein